MKRIMASVAQLAGTLAGLALIVFGGALLVMRAGYGGPIVIVCGVLILPSVFGRLTAKFENTLRALIATALVIIAVVSGTVLEGQPRTSQTSADRYVAAIDKRRAEQRAGCSDTGMAYVISQNFVKTKLAAPASAKFPSISEAKISSTDECEFEVQSFVDSQNTFGSMIRKAYTAKVRFDRQSESWVFENLVM